MKVFSCHIDFNTLPGQVLLLVQVGRNFIMLLGLVVANLGVSLLPASAMTLHTQGIVYRPLADVTTDITVETVVVWRREEISPLVQEFLAVHGSGAIQASPR